MNRFEADSAHNIVAAFDRLTAAQKSELIIRCPDLYFAVIRFVRLQQSVR